MMFRAPRNGLSLLLAMLVAATLWAWHAARRHASGNLQKTFTREVERSQALIHHRFEMTLQTVQTAAGMFRASPHVGAREWSSFLTGLHMSRNHPGLIGLAFVARVAPGRESDFVSQMRDDGEPSFVVRSEPGSDRDRFVVQYVEPLARREAVQGLDLADEPVRRIALERSRDSAMPMLTPPVRLFGASHGDTAVLLLVPVYRSDLPSLTVEQRRTALIGWGCAVIDANAFFASIVGACRPGIRLSAFDGDPQIALRLFSGESGADAEASSPVLLSRRDMVLLGSRTWTLEFAATRKAVDPHNAMLPWVTLTGGLVFDTLVLGMVWSASRTRRRAEQLARLMITNLSESERKAEKLALVAAATDNGVLIADARGRIEWVNQSLSRLTGYRAEQVIGASLIDLLAGLDDQQSDVRELQLALEAGRGFGFEHRCVRPDRTIIWLAVELQPIRDDRGMLGNFIVLLRDVTQQKRVREELLRESLHDKLTGLPNRALLMERLASCIAKAQRDPAFRFAVLFIDLDRFKVINDSLGHAAGDALLVAIANKLRHGLRSSDGVTVARLGGDEFTVLLDDISDASDAIRVAERLQRELSTPCTIRDHEVVTTISIGITVSDRGYRSPEDVLRDADIAMYRAKASGKARHELFDQDMHARVRNRLALENDLRRALANGEFEPHFQPIIELSTRRLIGFEALARWRHPVNGLASPAEFIPVAEETGLIIPLGRWMLAETCRQLVRWQRRHRDSSDLTVSVNLSVKQLAERGLVEQVARLLEETGLEATRLKLEITESAVMEDLASLKARLAELKRLNVQLYLDDFGTGYSSLSCLHQFPIDGLKIDRAFIQSMGLRRDYAAVVQAIVTLAHNLDIRVVAEGVENVDQLVQLQALDCDQGQGYHFGRPMPADEAESFITRMSEPGAAAA